MFSRLTSHLCCFCVVIDSVRVTEDNCAYTLFDVSACSPSFAFDVLDCLLKHKEVMSEPVNYFERFFPSLFKVVLAMWHVCVCAHFVEASCVWTLDFGVASFYISV